TVGLALGFVDATGVIVADPLLVTAFLCSGVLRGSFQNLVHHVAVFLVENISDAPRRVSRGDGIGGEPSAIRVLIEVSAGRRFCVHASNVVVGRLTKRSRDAEGDGQ